MDSSKRIPVKLSSDSVLDSEFSNMRERFDAEMQRMENEMQNFRTQLLSRQDNFFNTSSSFLSSAGESASSLLSSNSASKLRSTMMSSTGGTGSSLMPLGGGGQDSISSPLIQDDGDGKTLKLRFDVSQYSPEEIVLKTVDNKLLVHAKHEEKTETKSVYREYNREFLLPSGVNPELIRSSLSKDGVLTVEAPLPMPAITNK